MSRKTFAGELCVYREWSGMDRLSADVKLDDDVTVFYYHPAPKCFLDMITDGQENVRVVEFTANPDGRNPRSVKPISDPY